MIKATKPKNNDIIMNSPIITGNKSEINSQYNADSSHVL